MNRKTMIRTSTHLLGISTLLLFLAHSALGQHEQAFSFSGAGFPSGVTVQPMAINLTFNVPHGPYPASSTPGVGNYTCIICDGAQYTGNAVTGWNHDAFDSKIQNLRLDGKDAPGLQAADLLAYHSYQHNKSRVLTDIPTPLSKMPRILKAAIKNHKSTEDFPFFEEHGLDVALEPLPNHVRNTTLEFPIVYKRDRLTKAKA